MLTYSQKKYLFAIYNLGQNRQKIRSTEVAKIVGVTKPSTVKALQKLADDGYIVKEPYSEISITEKGISAANEVYTSSVIIEDFLRNVLGLDEETADKDTVAMVSHISSEGLDKLTEYILSIKSK